MRDKLLGRSALHTLAVQVVGPASAPWLTALHGFPTRSWDWVGVPPALAQDHRVLLLDLLGFGDSDKPARHRSSIEEQADLIEAV